MSDSDWESIVDDQPPHIFASVGAGPVNNQHIFSQPPKMQRPTKSVPPRRSNDLQPAPGVAQRPSIQSRLPVVEEYNERLEFVPPTVSSGGLADAFRQDRVPLPVPLNLSGVALVGGITFDRNRDVNNTLSIISHVSSPYSLIQSPDAPFPDVAPVGTWSAYRIGPLVTLHMTAFASTPKAGAAGFTIQIVDLTAFPATWLPVQGDVEFPVVIRTSRASGPLSMIRIRSDGAISIQASDTLSDYQWVGGVANQGWADINVSWLI